MMFLMAITFLTSRVILDKLGIVDYGIQNVVGGLASMFTFFRSSLANATQRYLSIALGKNDVIEANHVFCQHQTLYGVVAIMVIVIAEIVGLWLLIPQLTIPIERQNAAFWVFQFTTISLAITLLCIVYDSVLIAREEMKIYSYTGIVEGLAKLGIAYIISIIQFDHLIIYNILLTMVSLGIVLFYIIFCSKRFPEAKYTIYWNKKSAYNTFSFISWNMVGSAIWAVNEQGLNILLNVFCGPVVNAARGIAFQVNQAMNYFSSSFFTAVRPQIMKSYAASDYDYMFRLMFSSSKFSVFLFWYFALPLMLCIDVILSIWLVEVPAYTNVFTIWVLIFSLVNTFDNPIWTIALAIGKLKWYIIIGGSVYLMTFPISFIVLKMGYSPVSVFVVSAIVRCFYEFVVLLIIQKYISFSLQDYMIHVAAPVSFVVIISGVISCLLHTLLPANFLGVVLTTIVSTITITCCIFGVGLDKKERNKIQDYLTDKFLVKCRK